MAKCGMPTLPLKSENVYAVLMEAFSERASSDPDLDRSKADQNEFYGLSNSGRELADWFCKQAESYRITDKNGHEKRLRKDADICFAGIIKPDMEYINSLSRAGQKRFFADSMSILKGILEGKGLTLVACAIHYDELAPHVHYVAYDKEYKIAKKVGLPLFRQLNDTFPKLMREKGWELENLGKYNPEVTKTMTPEQKAAYKEERIAEKKAAKKHGQTSKQFKALKDIERAEKAVSYAKQKEAEISRGHFELQKRTEIVEARERKLVDREDDIGRLKTELREEGKALDTRSANLDEQERVFLSKKQHFSSQVKLEADRQLSERVPEITQRVTNEVFNCPDYDWNFLYDVVWKAVRFIVEKIEESFRVSRWVPDFFNRTEKFMRKHCEIITKSVVEEIIKERTEKAVEPEPEDPGIGFW